MNDLNSRIFIVSNANYPKGSANANYIHYLALALKQSGLEVHMIVSVNDEYSDDVIDGKYDELNILPIKISSNRIIKHFQYENGFSKQIIKHLKNANITKNDYVYLSSSSSIMMHKSLLSLRKERKFKLITGVLEFFAKEDFSIKNQKRNYENYIKCHSDYKTQSDLIMPISTYIEKYFKIKKNKTFIVLPLTESRENSTKRMDKYRFILPANGKMKDNLNTMIRSFLYLTDEELTKIELHLCGVKKEKILQILSMQEYEKLKYVLIIHRWMKYDELEDLYRQSHFLLLARDVCQMNVANFPSKVPEAMSYGVVPIVSNVGDYTQIYLKNIIDSFIVDGAEVKEFSCAIKKAINLTEEQYVQMSKNAEKNVAENFDYKVWSQKFKELFVKGI